MNTDELTASWVMTRVGVVLLVFTAVAVGAAGNLLAGALLACLAAGLEAQERRTQRIYLDGYLDGRARGMADMHAAHIAAQRDRARPTS